MTNVYRIKVAGPTKLDESVLREVIAESMKKHFAAYNIVDVSHEAIVTSKGGPKGNKLNITEG